jgi:hypothetical protein
VRAGEAVRNGFGDGAARKGVFQTACGFYEVVNPGKNTVNRIPVVNDEQRAGYGAPTTEVEGHGTLTLDGVKTAIKVRAIKAVAKKKPAAKAKAKK